MVLCVCAVREGGVCDCGGQRTTLRSPSFLSEVWGSISGGQACVAPWPISHFFGFIVFSSVLVINSPVLSIDEYILIFNFNCLAKDFIFVLTLQFTALLALPASDSHVISEVKCLMDTV